MGPRKSAPPPRPCRPEDDLATPSADRPPRGEVLSRGGLRRPIARYSGRLAGHWSIQRFTAQETPISQERHDLVPKSCEAVAEIGKHEHHAVDMTIDRQLLDHVRRPLGTADEGHATVEQPRLRFEPF